MKLIKLSSGKDIPIVGLGTWRAQPQEVENAVAVALEAGYRHIGNYSLVFIKVTVAANIKLLILSQTSNFLPP